MSQMRSEVWTVGDVASRHDRHWILSSSRLRPANAADFQSTNDVTVLQLQTSGVG